jgi:uncharacterized protein (DUF885 family)
MRVTERNMTKSSRARNRPLLAAVAVAAAAASAIAAPARGYDALLTLFADWREAQQPELEDSVPDHTPAAMRRRVERLSRLRARLLAIDPSAWPVPQQVDWHLVRAEMNGLDFDHRVLKPWERDPAFYSMVVPEQSDTPSKEGPAFPGALELWRLTFPLDAKGQAEVAAKLRAIPAVLQQARGNLTGDARDLWIAGIRAQKEQAKALGELATKLGAHHPDLVPHAAKAREAVDGFRSWLESTLSGKRGRSGVGTADYDWYVKNVHLSPFTWRDEVALHERELARATAHLALEEGRRATPPAEPSATADEWNRSMQDAVTDLMRFYREREVLTVKEWMEPALRARVSPWTEPAARDFFHQVEAREPFLLRLHGFHWIDLARMQHEPHVSPIRRGALLYNIWDSRAEGLATAMEELMSSAGVLENRPFGRQMVYAMVAQRAARGLASLRVHSGEMSLEEAVRFAADNTPHGWLKKDGGLVWFEQSLYLEQPGYGTCYLSGKALIERLLAERAREQGTRFSLKTFMDEMNAAGMIPVSLIRWEMTGRGEEIAPARPASSNTASPAPRRR